MHLLNKVLFFILGTILGSFYHVVATRLADGKSIISPPSHCENCQTRLKWYELIPIASYLANLGKCNYCQQKIPLSYLWMEVITGSLFTVCYKEFGFTSELLIALIFVSTLIIVIVSDIEYMIILDEVLLVATPILMIIYFIVLGIETTAKDHLYPAIFAFLTMYALKIIGDFMFKKESLGGGDIKLMFIFGLVIGYSNSILTIFLATFMAFPIAIYTLATNKDNMIPFGPFLSMAAILILVSGLSFTDIINFLVK